MSKKLLRTLLLAITLMILPGYGIGSAADYTRSSFPAVLMYHDIKKTPKNGFDVSLKDFRKQLDWLAANGYQTLTIDEFVEYALHNKPYPSKSVLITFDDGYAGIYTYAAPELHKRNMKATFFVFKKALGTNLPHYPYLTEEQVIKLSKDPLFSIQSHTQTHADLTEISPEQLKSEMEDSRKYIEDLLKKPCRTIAFPYGHYNEIVLKAVAQAGYEAAFSVSDLGLYNHDAKYSIPRIYMGVVLGKDNMKAFTHFVTNYQNMPKEAFAERFGPLPKEND